LEELHDGGVAEHRGIDESRLAILNAQRERRWPWMRSTEQNSGTQEEPRNGKKKKKKTGKMRTKKNFQKRFSERGHSRNEI